MFASLAIRFGGTVWRRATSVVVAVVITSAGCSNVPLGGGSVPSSGVGTSDGAMSDGAMSDGADGGFTPDAMDASDGNAPPTAVVRPVFSEGPDEILDGRRDAIAFLDGSMSSDSDGSVVMWEWFVGGNRVAIGASASLSDFEAGVTIVTLVVTDGAGAQGMADIRVLNPGFRPGVWAGRTDGGQDITFVIGNDFTVSSLAFGFAFDGVNALNGAPCSFVEPAEACVTCPASAEQCVFDLAWSADGEFSAQGSCIQAGDPPYEEAVGSVSASPLSNCPGSTGVIRWEASWVSP